VLATTPAVLAAAWIALQLPAAAIIASALALGGTSVAPARRGILSGLIGATSLVALLAGSLLVGAFGTAPEWAFLAAALLGAALACPLALRPPEATAEPSTSDRALDRRAAGSATSRGTAWVVFTVASFLLSWATASTNAFIVLYVDSSTSEGDVSGVATGAVTAGALAAIVASVVAGLLVRGRRSAALLWSGAAVMMAAALAAMLSVPTSTGIVVSGLAFGAGFGLANGAELGLLLFVRHRVGRLGRDLGIFTAATSVPSVLVPALGRVLLADDAADGLRVVFVGAAILALLAASITVGLARTTRAAA
jgi:MFS family permease